jgi:hypothetical protein
MGFGDDIMSTAFAAEAHRQFPEAKVVFGDPKSYLGADGKTLHIHFSEVFENNPNILQPGEPAKSLVCVPDYPGHRPSIRYPECAVSNGRITRFSFEPGFSAPTGDIFFSIAEKAAAAAIAAQLPPSFYVIEPHIAQKDWDNRKGYPGEKWDQVIEALTSKGYELVQFSSPASDKVHHAPTPTFRHALGLLACSSGFLGTDGGLHHGAAALGVPATVLWGHFSSPTTFGYPDQHNLRKAEGPGCGTTYATCEECEGSLGRIEVDEVVAAFEEMTHDPSTVRSQPINRPIFTRVVGTPPEGDEA